MAKILRFIRSPLERLFNRRFSRSPEEMLDQVTGKYLIAAAEKFNQTGELPNNAPEAVIRDIKAKADELRQRS